LASPTNQGSLLFIKKKDCKKHEANTVLLNH